MEKWIRGQILEGLNCERKECNLQPEGNSELLKVVEQKPEYSESGDMNLAAQIGKEC